MIKCNDCEYEEIGSLKFKQVYQYCGKIDCKALPDFIKEFPSWYIGCWINDTNWKNIKYRKEDEASRRYYEEFH